MSINRKVVGKNAYRITNKRNLTALRIRVPGGHISTKFFPIIQDIAQMYGNGTVHITTRQGFEIPDIDFKYMKEINILIRPLIEDLGLNVEVTDDGYPAAGTRNISACIGNRVCSFSCDDTTSMARNIEQAFYPNNLHFKIAVAGCSNDCIKAHMQDFGIICMTEPQYDVSRCISCKACVDTCKKKVTGALSFNGFNVQRDEDKCIGCGECVLKCPTRAWSRSTQKYYRLVIMGRTGKRNPRIAMPFIKWCSEDVFMKIIANTYDFVQKHIDKSLAKEHIGYIVDRVGYQTFKSEVLESIDLNKEAKIAENIQWDGYWYKQDNQFK